MATHILADFGADVIKIEALDGDVLRRYEPARHDGMAGIFLHLNRNKRSVALDLKQPAAAHALDHLIASADVFVHALRPKAIERLGYDYDRVRALNPDIVYCGSYGFGAGGRYADKAAYDDLIQAGCGLAALQGAMHGEVGYLPTVIADKAAGQAIACAILAALFQRQGGGGGQAVEVPMYETMVEFCMIEHMGGKSFDPPIGKTGFVRVLSPNRKPYPTKDGYACILPYSDKNWRDFFRLIDRPDLASDPRYQTHKQRAPIIDELYGVIAAAAPRYTTDEWIEMCDGVSIPCMPVFDLDSLVDNPHLADVDFFAIEEHPTEGAYRSMRSPTRFSGADTGIRQYAPRLGEHTAALLADAGLSDEEIAAAIGGATVSAAAPRQASAAG
jgi:crotonobetainyl-CoA:carnitine CoA-transferase CaiB-like acyl-CoA transferase